MTSRVLAALLALSAPAWAAPDSDEDMGRRVQALLHAHQADVYACVQKQSQAVEGEALLRVVLGDGAAERVEVLKTDAKPAVRAVADCVADAVRGWDLAALHADVGDQVVFPLAFRGDAPGSDAGAIGARVTLEPVRANTARTLVLSKITAFYVLGPGAPRFRDADGAAVSAAVNGVVLAAPGRLDIVATAASTLLRIEASGDAPLPGPALRAIAWRALPSYALPGGRGEVRLYLDGIAGAPFAIERMCGKAGSGTPLHAHAGSDEIVYVASGRVHTRLPGQGEAPSSDVDRPGDVVIIPRGVQHAMDALADFCAVQIYAPAGPEQRFKASPRTQP